MSVLQEEVEVKTRQLARLERALSGRRAEVAEAEAAVARERDDFLEDMRALTQQIKLKDLLIASYIPPAHQELIMQQCTWDDQASLSDLP